MTDPTETARALLWRHGLPEDVIDGALCLHAQELAAVQRKEADDLHQTEPGVVKGLRIGADLIDPACETEPSGVEPATAQTALRERIAQALMGPDAAGTLDSAADEMIDAVLALLPAPAGRAAVLRGEAALIRAHCPDHLDADSAVGSWMNCHCDVADDMERRAAESAPADTGHAAGEAWDVPDARPGTTDYTLLRRSEDICPGFPDHCPNLRTVEPEPGVHGGGIRCGCADEQPAAEPQPVSAEFVQQLANVKVREPRADHERQQAHAEGEHAFCGAECEQACTCAAAGDAFAPLGHYRDCPQAADQPAAAQQPKEA